MNLGELLRANRNYRWTWTGQVVSEVGDHFNNIAVFSLAMQHPDPGMVVAGTLIARAIPMLAAGPIAGVLLDRFDRKKIMIASDLIRAVIAALFIFAAGGKAIWPLYTLSALLMCASPFFTAGRSAILPSITTPEQLHSANSFTQTTSWATTAIGAFLGGASVAGFGYDWAFFLNAMSFLFSAWCISMLRSPSGSFRAETQRHRESVSPWRDYADGLRYLRDNPLLAAIALIGVGWATGGGAAQILFSLFGETVFQRGPAGIGQIWGCAAIGLVIGGAFAHWLAPRLSFRAYKRSIVVAYLVHGFSYVAFALMPGFVGALVMIAVSRAAVAVSSVLNTTVLMRNLADEFRGRVFATMETLVWSTMMISMMVAGVASTRTDPRTIGVYAGIISSTTAIFWAAADWGGRLPEPRREPTERTQVTS